MPSLVSVDEIRAAAARLAGVTVRTPLVPFPLNGGDPARTITLPKRTLRPGGYRLDVRLVSRVNPGAVTGQRSALLTVG